MSRRPASVVYGLDGNGDIRVADRSTETTLMTIRFHEHWAKLSPAKKLALVKAMAELIEERETALGPTGSFGFGRER